MSRSLRSSTSASQLLGALAELSEGFAFNPQPSPPAPQGGEVEKEEMGDGTEWHTVENKGSKSRKEKELERAPSCGQPSPAPQQQQPVTTITPTSSAELSQAQEEITNRAGTAAAAAEDEEMGNSSNE